MATKEKWEHSDSQEEEEEEALSLCDLPVNLIKEEEKEVHHQESEIIQEDFNFGHDYSEMCAADDIFFKGQILPFRLSVSSESGNKFIKQDNSNPNRCLSRSESMDHNSTGGFTSFSSRSSSSRSQFSSTSTNSSSVNTRIPNPRIQNQFHTHPSPKPQIRLSKNSLGNAATNKNRKSSTVWDFFRLGLVRTPEIELQDLKIRASSVSRNSSSGSSSSNSSNSNVKISSNKNMQKQRKQSFLEKKGTLLSGCSCTVSAVKPVPLNIIIVKSSTTNSTGKNSGNDKCEESTKLQEMKIKKKMVEKEQGKQTMSRHRTFEWIKELSSHASFLDHESNNT